MKHYLITIIILLAAWQGAAYAQGENDTLWTKMIDGITDVKFSPDGKNIAFSRQNGEIYIVNSVNGDSIYKFSQPGGYYFDYSPDGKYLVTTGIIDEKTSDTELIRVLDIESRTLSRYLLDTLKSKVEGLITARTIAYSNDGKYIAVGFWAESDGFRKSWVVVWETLNFTTVTYNYYPQSSIIKIRFTPDSKFLAASFGYQKSNYILLIDTETWDEKLPALQHPDMVEDFTFTNNGTRLITGCDDDNIRIWNTETRVLERILKIEGNIKSMGISNDNNYIFYQWKHGLTSGLFKKEIKTEEILYKYNTDVFQVGRTSMNSIDISPNQPYFAAGSSVGICVYKSDLNTSISEFKYKTEILYPNPTTGLLTIPFNNPKRQHIQICVNNEAGLNIANISNGIFEQGDNQIFYNASDLPAGIYIISITSSSLNLSYKLIKEK